MKKMSASPLKKAADFLRNNDNFVIIAHDHPDGDTLGSSLALSLFLKKIGKNVKVVCSGDIPKVFQFLPGIELFQKDFLSGDHQSIILVDNGDLKRTGFEERLRGVIKKRQTIINFDHHPQNDIWKMAQINVADPNVSSTAELIFALINEIDQKIIDHRIATNLLAGLYTDTGGFQHPTTSAEVLRLAGVLLSHGAKLKQIKNEISGERSIDVLKLWGKVLNNLHFNRNRKIVYSVISQREIRALNCSEEDLTGIVNLLNTTPEAEVALLLYETKDAKIKGSLRTESNQVDISKLAIALGGGGHKRAAGFVLEGKLQRVGNGWKVV